MPYFLLPLPRKRYFKGNSDQKKSKYHDEREIQNPVKHKPWDFLLSLLRLYMKSEKLHSSAKKYSQIYAN